MTEQQVVSFTNINGLSECFIQVKATVKLPLSTYDTIIPLRTVDHLKVALII